MAAPSSLWRRSGREGVDGALDDQGDVAAGGGGGVAGRAGDDGRAGRQRQSDDRVVAIVGCFEDAGGRAGWGLGRTDGDLLGADQDLGGAIVAGAPERLGVDWQPAERALGEAAVDLSREDDGFAERGGRL